MLKRFLKKYGYLFVIGFAFLLGTVYLQSISPLILGDIFDALKLNPLDNEVIFGYIGTFILVGVGVFATRFIWRNCILGNGRMFESFLRRELFAHLQRMSSNFYASTKTGELMAYAVNDISAVYMMFGPTLANLCSSSLTAILSGVFIVTQLGNQMAFWALIPAPFVVIIAGLIGHIVRKQFALLQKNYAQISDRAQENISGIRVIKAYAEEAHEVDRFEELNEQMRISNVRLVKTSALLEPLSMFLFRIGFIVALIYSGNAVRQGTMTLGDFVAFNGLFNMVMTPVLALGRINTRLQRGVASYARLRAVFDVLPDIVDGPNKMPSDIKGCVEFQDLSFSYPLGNGAALRHISAKVLPGQTIGIVGRTGSGKTTLLSLISRVQDPPKGKLFIDGYDVRQLSFHSLREKLGVSPQDNFLFADTISNNIRFFDSNLSTKDVAWASKAADVYDDITAFPDGFETKLGERGVNLSGGQRQRLSIARAIIRKPKILILDDALSAVDTETEERILKNLREITKGCTVFISAHRTSVVKNADQIWVMDQGEIIERGTHDALLNQGGAYAQLYYQQLKEGHAEEVSHEKA